ncbi:MAG: transporter substrate-binding domain-containing protein [Pseudodesulfovibrio sp.]
MADETVVILATDYPPYAFEHPEGELRGYDIEVVEEVLSRADYEVEHQFYPWSRAVRMVHSGEGLALASCIKTVEREKFLVFSDPISKMTPALIVARDFVGDIPHRYEDFGDLEVGTMIDWATTGWLTENGISHDLSPNEEVALRKLADGRIQALYTTLESSLYLIKKMGLSDMFKWGIVEEAIVTLHLAFNKHRPETAALVKVFNEKLAEMKADGSYEAIHARYK